MRRLKEQQPLLMGDEEHHNIFDGIQDIRYARDFLHVTGLPGSAEHARFDEMSWGYGDPTYMGGDLLEVFESQLKSVIHTLFGVHEQEAGEDALRADLHHAGVAMGEDDFLADLVSLDGSPLRAETVGRISPRTMAEHLTHQAPTPATSRANYPGEGVASVGYGGLNSQGYRVALEPTGDFGDVIGVEISGGPESIAAFICNMLAGCGEGEPPNLYRWKAGSPPARTLREGVRRSDAVIMLVGFEYFDLRSMMHDIVFARLLAAWREMKRNEVNRSEPQ